MSKSLEDVSLQYDLIVICAPLSKHLQNTHTHILPI